MPDWLREAQEKYVKGYTPPPPDCPEGFCDGSGLVYELYALDGIGLGSPKDCECTLKRIERQKFEGLIGRSLVDPAKTFETIIVRNESVRLALQDFKSHGHRSFYIFGPMGTGKTRTIQASVVRAAKMGIPSAFVSVPKLLHMTRPSEPESDTLWRQAMNIPYLALDDIGKESPNTYIMNRLFMLIDERYTLWQRGVAHTSFTSQHGLNSTENGDGLEDILDPAIADRIREMCLTIHLDGESFRKGR
jgi:DNA replication protein DnaC